MKRNSNQAAGSHRGPLTALALSPDSADPASNIINTNANMNIINSAPTSTQSREDKLKQWKVEKHHLQLLPSATTIGTKMTMLGALKDVVSTKQPLVLVTSASTPLLPSATMSLPSRHGSVAKENVTAVSARKSAAPSKTAHVVANTAAVKNKRKTAPAKSRPAASSSSVVPAAPTVSNSATESVTNEQAVISVLSTLASEPSSYAFSSSSSSSSILDESEDGALPPANKRSRAEAHTPDTATQSAAQDEYGSPSALASNSKSEVVPTVGTSVAALAGDSSASIDSILLCDETLPVELIDPDVAKAFAIPASSLHDVRAENGRLRDKLWGLQQKQIEDDNYTQTLRNSLAQAVKHVEQLETQLSSAEVKTHDYDEKTSALVELELLYTAARVDIESLEQQMSKNRRYKCKLSLPSASASSASSSSSSSSSSLSSSSSSRRPSRPNSSSRSSSGSSSNTSLLCRQHGAEIESLKAREGELNVRLSELEEEKAALEFANELLQMQRREDLTHFTSSLQEVYAVNQSEQRDLTDSHTEWKTMTETTMAQLQERLSAGLSKSVVKIRQLQEELTVERTANQELRTTVHSLMQQLQPELPSSEWAGGPGQEHQPIHGVRAAIPEHQHEVAIAESPFS